MRDAMTFKELLAAVVRHGRLTIILMAVLALLLGVWRGIRLHSTVSEQDFAMQQEEIKTKLTRAQQHVDIVRNYLEKSPLMEVDPYEKWVAELTLQIADGEDTTSSTLSEGQIRSLRNRYCQFWDTVDLQDQMEGYRYSDTEDIYLRLMVSLSGTVDGVCITAIGATEEDAVELAASAYSLLKRAGESFSDQAPHVLALAYSKVQAEVDVSLQDVKSSAESELQAAENEVVRLERQAEDLELQKQGVASRTGVTVVIKYAVLGALLGAVVAVIWVLLSQMFDARIISAHQMEECIQAPCLGLLTGSHCGWGTIANVILGERPVGDLARAAEYVTQRSDVLLPAEGSITLLSTLPAKETDESVQAALASFSALGRPMAFVPLALSRGDTAGVIRDSGCVVLLEKAGTSRCSAVAECAVLCQRMDTPLGGFVLL